MQVLMLDDFSHVSRHLLMVALVFDCDILVAILCCRFAFRTECIDIMLSPNRRTHANTSVEP